MFQKPSDEEVRVGRASLVLTEPHAIRFGALRPGRSAHMRLGLIARQRAASIDVYRITTSCPCVIVEPKSIRIDGKTGAEVSVKFDPATEPDFRGPLAVELKGFDRQGVELFSTQVFVSIAD
ncbi:MAG: hypothetical protein ACP5XB_07035 [Isosphaeraceae bacterium]